MMTAKQQWFIMKLINECEELGYDGVAFHTFLDGNEYDSYSTTKQEASKDISFLLRVKEIGLQEALDEQAKEMYVLLGGN